MGGRIDEESIIKIHECQKGWYNNIEHDATLIGNCQYGICTKRIFQSMRSTSLPTKKGRGIDLQFETIFQGYYLDSYRTVRTRIILEKRTTHVGKHRWHKDHVRRIMWCLPLNLKHKRPYSHTWPYGVTIQRWFRI